MRHKPREEEPQDVGEAGQLFLRSLEALLWTAAAVAAAWLAYRQAAQWQQWLWLLFGAPFLAAWLLIQGLQRLQARWVFPPAAGDRATGRELPRHLRPGEDGVVRRADGRPALAVDQHQLVCQGGQRQLTVRVRNLSAGTYAAVLLKVLAYDADQRLLGVAAAEVRDLASQGSWTASVPLPYDAAVRGELYFQVRSAGEC